MQTTGDRLDSWKEIAAHLGRSVRTVTRWEREEGLPVRRHVHGKAGTVFAYKSELDAWWVSRGAKIDRSATDSFDDAARRHRTTWMAVGAASLLIIVAGIWMVATRRPLPPAARLAPLTTYAGVEGPPSLSPDGNQVAFEQNGDIFVKPVDGEALVRLTTTSQAEAAPAWSPDSRQIAFSRAEEGIFIVSPLGGGERRIARTSVPLLLKTISWTPDSRFVVASEMTSPVSASLFVVNVETGEKRRLTWPHEPTIGDGWPAVSPDGRTVAFARYTQDTSANVYLVPLTGGEPRQLTADNAPLFGITWAADDEVIFALERAGTSRLWSASTQRVPAVAVVPVPAAGDDARFPVASRASRGGPLRLAYQRFVQNIDVRRAEIVADATRGHTLKSSVPLIASTRSDDHPSYSPDGTKIAFVSRRSGTDEIWVCKSDASNPVRLTSMDGPPVIAPRWSPDGRRIAFFAATGEAGAYRMYVVPAEGGQPSRLIATEGALEALPSWSRDGSWVYFTSGRSGSLQIWKMPANGGESTQLTRNGGAEAIESPDGKTVYYVKVPEMGPGLWSVPSTGGIEVRELGSVRFGYWTMSSTGIYFIDFDVVGDAPRPVRFFDFESRSVSQIGSVEPTVSWRNTPGFAISPDSRWLLYSSLESTDADLMLVDNFR